MFHPSLYDSALPSFQNEICSNYFCNAPLGTPHLTIYFDVITSEYSFPGPSSETHSTQFCLEYLQEKSFVHIYAVEIWIGG